MKEALKFVYCNMVYAGDKKTLSNMINTVYSAWIWSGKNGVLKIAPHDLKVFADMET